MYVDVSHPFSFVNLHFLVQAIFHNFFLTSYAFKKNVEESVNDTYDCWRHLR